jgi:hypothetical protein
VDALPVSALSVDASPVNGIAVEVDEIGTVPGVPGDEVAGAAAGDAAGGLVEGKSSGPELRKASSC